MRKKRLILWDIDSTLINTGSAGQHALARATIDRFGADADLTGVEIAGRTDIAIAHQVLKKYGEEITTDNVDAF
ncbi:MAG TPA: hydrolase, partial [Chthoniobacterales bacterium]